MPPACGVFNALVTGLTVETGTLKALSTDVLKGLVSSLGSPDWNPTSEGIAVCATSAPGFNGPAASSNPPLPFPQLNLKRHTP